MAIRDVKVLLTLLEGEVVYKSGSRQISSAFSVPVQRAISAAQRGSSSGKSP